MKKMAIISSPHLPIPAVEVGAVETLATYIIEGNENKHTFDIDVFTTNHYLLDILIPIICHIYIN